MSTVIHLADFPYGVRCALCDKLMMGGETYSEVLDGFAGDMPVVILTCAPCAFWGDK